MEEDYPNQIYLFHLFKVKRNKKNKIKFKTYSVDDDYIELIKIVKVEKEYNPKNWKNTIKDKVREYSIIIISRKYNFNFMDLYSSIYAQIIKL